MAIKSKSTFITSIIVSSLIAGTLDALAAIFILAHGQAAMVFRYIASAVYGKGAFSGGACMIWAGVAFHYIIATTFTVFFFIAYSYISLLRKNTLLVILIYGIFAWAVMNLLVLPLTRVVYTITLAGAIENILILCVTIALPAVVIRHRYEQLGKIL
jgi:hypothetical protein